MYVDKTKETTMETTKTLMDPPTRLMDPITAPTPKIATPHTVLEYFTATIFGMVLGVALTALIVFAATKPEDRHTATTDTSTSTTLSWPNPLTDFTPNHESSPTTIPNIDTPKIGPVIPQPDSIRFVTTSNPKETPKMSDTTRPDTTRPDTTRPDTPKSVPPPQSGSSTAKPTTTTTTASSQTTPDITITIIEIPEPTTLTPGETFTADQPLLDMP